MDTIDALLVSTSYPVDLSDWRGLFMRHLVDAFARRKDLHLRVWAPPGKMPDRVTYVATSAERDWLSGLMAAGGIIHLMRTGGVQSVTAPLRLLLALRRAYHRNAMVDVYHVNWLQNALPLPRNGRPALVTVLGSDFQLLQRPGMRALLRRSFRNRPVAICPNADWMVPSLQAAFGDIAEVAFVPFGIDPDWFQIKRLVTRPTRRWICVSRLTRAKLGALFEYGEGFFAGTGRELHLFGPMQESIELPAWVHHHGPASPEVLCRDWFPHVDGLISLSAHAEGRPQVMLEAMAAALPIIASDLPAHASFVRHRSTGWLCDSQASLGEALATLEDPDVNQRIGAAARQWASEHVGTWDDCAERYMRLYRQLLGQVGQ